jgi:hypothetical protein
MTHGKNLNESVTVTNTAASAGDHTGEGSNQLAKALVEHGRIYVGSIQHCAHGDQTYDVTLEGRDTVMPSCLWGSGIFLSLLGIKTAMLPTVGTRVYVLAGSPSIILGTLPSSPRDTKGGKSRTMTSCDAGASKMRTGNSEDGVFHSIPADMLEGEFAIENGLGVALQFLTNLIALKGSDRAKVETHLLNDMVRIFSGTFKHFSALGDYEIYNDGGLNLKFEGTSREHEAMGATAEDGKRVDVGKNRVEFTDDLIASARWRFSQYIGFLGDFVHVFVTDPSTLASNIGASMRAGKSRFWQGMDGTCLLQSVAEISLERVVRIPVPQELKRWDDPEGVLKTTWQNLVNSEKGFTEVWNYGGAYKDIHKAAYQLREYARWLSCFHSYARFHQYDREEDPEWHVPNEESITHEWTNKETDVESANPHLKPGHFDTYACIRIMRDGAIVLWDGYGSSVSMSRRLIQISATRHVEIEAGGDIRMIAGNDILMRARRHVEIVATKGSFVTKARTAWKALVEWGSMWLKSDAQDPASPGFVAPVLDDAEEDPEPEIHDSAIIIDTSRGRTTVNSARTLTLQTDGNKKADTTDATDITKSVIIQSQLQDVKVVGGRSLHLKSMGAEEGWMAIDSAKAVVLTSPKLLTDSFVFDVNGAFTVRNGVVNASTIRAFSVASQAPLRGGLALDNVSDSPFPGFHPHENHVLISDEDDEPEFSTSDELEARTTYSSDIRSSVKYVSPFDTADPRPGPEWKLYAPDLMNYEWTYISTYPEEEQLEQRLVTLAQQRLDFDTDISGQYKDWVLTNDKLKSAPRTVSSEIPYPGKAKELYHDTDIDPLHKVFPEEYKDMDPSIATDLVSRDFTRRFLKVSSNKP